jgi:two-component system, OmpR family, phosphate regulon sensor histidine kinase PhoR
MKNPTPRLIAILSALVMTLVGVLIVVLLNAYTLIPVWLKIFIPIVLGLAMYVIVVFILEWFLYRKIKLIYKNISSQKSQTSSSKNKIDLDKDIIGQAETEAMDWLNTRNEEIKSLKNLEQFRKEFLGNVSHELKTPIFSVQGYLHTLLDGGINDQDINIYYLKKAALSVDRLSEIVSDLNIISNLESGEIELDPRIFDIYDLVKEVFESLEWIAGEKSVDLKIKDGCLPPFYVNADRDKTRQVLVNLISNSIKYGLRGGNTQVGFYDMDDHVLVEVSDNGIGISEEHLPRLFERFYRADKSRSREHGGTGLGLAIVKHILEAHGQSIHVRSSVGVGTTFGFTLLKPKK